MVAVAEPVGPRAAARQPVVGRLRAVAGSREGERVLGRAAEGPALLEVRLRELGSGGAGHAESLTQQVVTEVPRVHLVAGRVGGHDVPGSGRREAGASSRADAREQRGESDPTRLVPEGEAHLRRHGARLDEEAGLTIDRVHDSVSRCPDWQALPASVPPILPWLVRKPFQARPPEASVTAGGPIRKSDVLHVLGLPGNAALFPRAPVPRRAPVLEPGPDALRAATSVET